MTKLITRCGLLAAIWIASLAAAAPVDARTKSVGYEYGHVAQTNVHVVTVDLNDPQVMVTLVLARDGIGRVESFASMIHRTQPDAAITGTFFGIKCLLPIGNLVRDGRLLCPVATGTTIAITRDNRAVLVTTRVNQDLDWTNYSAAVFAGPTLLRDGRRVLDPPAEGFRDPAHYRPARRTAIGIKANNKLLLVAVTQRISLSRLTRVMKALGARDAFALDGGTSTALHYRGSTPVRPGRSLTHIIAIYAKGRPPIVAQTPALRNRKPG